MGRGDLRKKRNRFAPAGPRCLSAAWRRHSSFVCIALDTSLRERKSWTCLCFEELSDLGSLIRVKHRRISRVFKHSLRLWYPSPFIYKYLFKGLPLSERDKCTIVITMQRLWSEDSTHQSLQRSQRILILNPNSSTASWYIQLTKSNSKQKHFIANNTFCSCCFFHFHFLWWCSQKTNKPQNKTSKHV